MDLNGLEKSLMDLNGLILLGLAGALGFCSTSCIVIEHNWLVILSGLAILAPSLPLALLFGAIGVGSVHSRDPTFGPSWIQCPYWILTGLVNAAQVYIGICVLMIGCMGHAEVSMYVLFQIGGGMRWMGVLL